MQRCACDRRPVNWYAHPHTTYRRSAAHRNRHPDRSTLPTRSPGQTRTSTRRKPPKYTAKKCFIGSNTKTPRPPHRVDRPVALRPVRSSAIPQTVAMHTLLRSGQRGIRGTVTGCGCPTRSPARALTSAGNPRNPHHPRPPSEPQEHRAERGSSTAGSIPNSCRDACPLDPSELWPIPDPDPLEPLETPKPNMGHRPPATRPPIPLRSQPTAYEAGALLLFVSSARPPS